MKTKFLFFVSLLFVCAFGASSAMAQDDEGDALVGLWLPSEGTARIQVYKGGKSGKYFGRIVWLKEPNDEDGKPKTDKKNPDESLRDKPLMGYVMLRGFSYKGNKVWDGGTIYDPKSGSTYNCEINMKNKNSIEVRGYIGVSLFGRTDTWTRMKTN
ncbi:MAG: DUF2147 domain-containing protein [Bernardetiaceae bacterium]